MPKNVVVMDRLKSLLNIETIVAKSDINSKLKNIAKILMNEYYISNGTHLYRPIEIEFYIYLKDISEDEKRHADEHVYPRTAEAGRIFFHRNGMDICFLSSMKDGYFGGILIRALEREDKEHFGGPRICAFEVLNSATGMCAVQKCEHDQKLSFDVEASERIGIKEWTDSKSNWKDEYYNKKYRFVRKGLTEITITLPKFDFRATDLKYPNKKYKL